mmetsp:Transcript_79319/g.242705  ORF Transcript_79319/g.242705 Transcript_79319/m.242705 type:complete len:258 (+) Transcript_79319:1708-2481(+)
MQTAALVSFALQEETTLPRRSALQLQRTIFAEHRMGLAGPYQGVLANRILHHIHPSFRRILVARCLTCGRKLALRERDLVQLHRRLGEVCHNRDRRFHRPCRAAIIANASVVAAAFGHYPEGCGALQVLAYLDEALCRASPHGGPRQAMGLHARAWCTALNQRNWLRARRVAWRGPKRRAEGLAACLAPLRESRGMHPSTLVVLALDLHAPLARHGPLRLLLLRRHGCRNSKPVARGGAACGEEGEGGYRDEGHPRC